MRIDNQNKTEEAHRTVFGGVQEVSDRDIVFDVIVQVSYLTKDYTGSLSTTDFTSNNYCPEKLKSKIENCSTYKSSVSSAKPTYFESSLLYNNKITTEKLLCVSFQLGTNKQ